MQIPLTPTDANPDANPHVLPWYEENQLAVKQLRNAALGMAKNVEKRITAS
jgi:hypothetical protein